MAKLIHKELSYTGGGSSGLLPHIVITSDAENTITVTTPSGSTITPTSTVSGIWECDGDEYGTYTITATYDEHEAEDTVVVDTVKVYAVEIHIVTIPDGSTVLPTDDIEKWLLCADIKDKSYTTLNEVLADSETYNALLGDSNACAYMKRSTTWSTDICASQYAMNLLGQYDTACDALLSDSTWASAIANSTYFESVLNVKVPVMTSNTTPSGEASASSVYSNAPYLAFDGDAGTYWMASSISNESITYDFGEPVVVKKMFLGASSVGSGGVRVHDYIIQGSNDGSTYTNIQSGTHGSTDETVDISNNIAYRYHRLFIANTASGQAGYFIAVNTLQFYGRASSSEKIHGGNPTYDSFYRIVDGNNVPVTDPSLLDAGTYTIYSNGLAKNPSDLSADYGKTVRICPNTKEIVVRPDNSLYWWGYENPNLEDCTSANGWSGSFSYVSPTHNQQNISLSSTSNTMCGIGTKNITNASKFYGIATQTSGSNARVLASNAVSPSKSTANNMDISEQFTSSISCQNVSNTVSPTYASVRFALGGVGTCNAFWYE